VRALLAGTGVLLVLAGAFLYIHRGIDLRCRPSATDRAVAPLKDWVAVSGQYVCPSTEHTFTYVALSPYPGERRPNSVLTLPGRVGGVRARWLGTTLLEITLPPDASETSYDPPRGVSVTVRRLVGDSRL
jgi:hypothetical protein